ncbi:MAG: hypothetical protein IKH51_10820 [Clostridia bacterium]|nr:hypothetical protein [Clostridia bacterium]
MKNKRKKELLYSAVSDINDDNVADFIRYENSLPERSGKAGSYHPVLRIAGAFAVCAVIFGGMFAALKYLEYRGGLITNPPETASSDTSEETEITAETETAEETGTETDAESTYTPVSALRIIAATDGGALFAGEDAFVYIKLENVKELASLCLTVAWDERLTLDFAEYANIGGIKNQPDDGEWSEVGNSFTFNWLALEPENALKSDLTFVTLRFFTPDESGDYPVTITADPNNVFDNSDQNVPFTISNTIISTVSRELTEPYETTDQETEPVTTDTEPVITEAEQETETETETETVTETEAETEAEKGKEFRSVQKKHETNDALENPTVMYTSNPYNWHPDVGIYSGKPSYIAFKVLDCGHDQFEALLARTGKKLSDGLDTSYIRENLLTGKLKFWLCDLDGNKIDYVYANKNGIVGFELYPGEYRIMYEDDGMYKTNYSSIVGIYEDEEGSAYYVIYDSEGKVGSNAYVCIYNYQRYKPVTITVTDDITGEPLKDVYVAYQSSYLAEDKDYLKTDGSGQLKLQSIFDLPIYNWAGSITSWQSDISLYFEKEGYDGLRIKTDNVKETSFEVQLHKTEYIEYTIKVQNKETGEPIKGAKLVRNSTIHGEFIIEESGEDGILKGILPSYDLKNQYGEPSVMTDVTVTYECDTARYGSLAQINVPLNRGVYEFTLLFTNVGTREPEGEFEFVPFW